MKSFCISFLAVVLGLLTSPLPANEHGPARTELERFAEGLETFQAEFTQTVIAQDGSIQDQSGGNVWLQSRDTLRWVYVGDFPETIVADGKNIWIYDESLQQVTVKPQSSESSDSPLMILADVKRLDEQFNVAELGAFEDVQILELKSRQEASEFERILLGLDAGGIRMMAMEDAFGQRTEIRFAGAHKNTGLDAGLFVFTPPEGADVVGVAALQE
ncbi:MAG: outer membrane lipoprotein chaperone LolA [Xanthomonadales bacterium]|nr:outer membrane lipoprotein chaperone LolA [Xanthomonadales bacterium]